MDYYIASWKFPIGAMVGLECLAILFFLPLLDQIVYPYFSSSGSPFGVMQRIQVGYASMVLAMLCAAMVEIWRKKSTTTSITSTCDSRDYISTLSLFYQIPQYFLCGLGAVFVRLFLVSVL